MVPHCTCLWGTSFRRNVHLWLNICIVDDTLRDEALLRSFREVVYGITMYTMTKSVFHALPATREGTAQANTAGTYATKVTCKPLFCFIGPEYPRARGKQRGSTCSRHVESNHHYSNRAKTALRYGGDKLINLITALCFDFDLTTDQEKTKKGRRRGVVGPWDKLLGGPRALSLESKLS